MDVRNEEETSRIRELIEARDRLVRRIVEELRSRGYFRTRVDARAGQPVIDLRWAAQLAGRELGCRLRTAVRPVDHRLPGTVTVIVAPASDVAKPQAFVS